MLSVASTIKLVSSSDSGAILRKCVNQCLKFSSASANELVKLDLDVDTGIAVATLNRPPANSLSLEMLQAISDSIKIAENERKIQALILSSSLPSIFCAGLDLTEIYKPDPVRLPKFWKSFQQVYFDLYGSRLATIAAMEGHAPAAGCMLALSCDYRVMSLSGKIGLNESLLGIAAPPWLGQQYIDTIGHRQAELALSLGTLFTPQEALEIGLVDDIVTDDNEVLEVAKKHAKKWVKIPPQARIASKELTRGHQIESLLKNRDHDIDHFITFVSHEKVQRNLGAYLEQLAQRKKE